MSDERVLGTAMHATGVCGAKRGPTAFPSSEQQEVGVKMKRPARTLGEPGMHFPRLSTRGRGKRLNFM
jgi:hypothetical protein